MQAINWIVRFAGLVFLILFQVLVLNKLNVGTYAHPYVYPMFILLLPFDTPKWLIMPLAFMVGLVIDMFNNTAGMHAFACVLIAYLRPQFLKLFTPITGYENVTAPSVSQLGVIWFALYTLTMIFIHHVGYYLLQVFWLNDLGLVFMKVVFSTALSTMLIVILAFLFATRKSRV